MICHACNQPRKPVDMVSSYQCRECRNAKTRAHRERRKAEGRPYYAGKPKRCTERQKLAQDLIQRMIERGDIVPPVKCNRCASPPASGFKRLDAHHQDYIKPLEVEWLCRTCHIRAHDQPGACINAEGPVDRALYSLTPKPRGESGLYGVTFQRKWYARFNKAFLGRFETAHEAARAYDHAARAASESRKLNFPQESAA